MAAPASYLGRMAPFAPVLKSAVTALLVWAPGSALAQAQDAEIGRLFAQLSGPDWERAETRLQTLFSRSGSASIDYLLRRGEEALEDEEFDLAVEHLSAAIDHDPSFAEAYHARATAWYRLERPGLAMDDLESVLAIEPRHWGALTGVGVIMSDLGFEEEALAAFLLARSIHPNLDEVNEAIERLEIATAGSTL